MLKFGYTFVAILLLCSVFPKDIVTSENVPIESNPEIINTEGMTPYAIYNTCGGVVEAKLDQLVILEYKPNEDYANNEMCVWTIRNDESNNMLLTKTQSDFEVGYDYIQVGDFSNRPWEGPDSSRQMGLVSGYEQLTALRPLAYLVFSSDSSNVGKGFRMEIVGFSRRSTHYWFDDFFTLEPNGETSLRPYHKSMFTTFTIAPQLTAANSLVLDVEYATQTVYHFVTIFQLERNGQEVNFKLLDKLDGNGMKSYEAFYYTYFIVMFTSDTREVAQNGGVTLTWHEPSNSTKQY